MIHVFFFEWSSDIECMLLRWVDIDRERERGRESKEKKVVFFRRSYLMCKVTRKRTNNIFEENFCRGLRHSVDDCQLFVIDEMLFQLSSILYFFCKAPHSMRRRIWIVNNEHVIYHISSCMSHVCILRQLTFAIANNLWKFLLFALLCQIVCLR